MVLDRRAVVRGLAAILACVAFRASAQRMDSDRAENEMNPPRARFSNRPVDDLIGEPVTDANGVPIGSVVDVVTDRRRQFFAVVGIARYLGLGARNVALPVDALRVSVDRLVLNDPLTTEQLAALPDFQPEQYRSIIPQQGFEGAR